MLQNTIKTARRSLWKNKGFSLLNVLGLTLGISTCLLILFYVTDELSFDKYNLRYERIYRINTDLKFNNTVSSRAIVAPVVAEKMMSDFPEVEKATRILPDRELVKKGDEMVSENNIAYCDANIFDVFSFPFLFGNPQTALHGPNDIVISESTAKKYFSKIDVVGETITTEGDSNSNVNYTITGVMKDMPSASHFHFDMLLLMRDDAVSRNKNVAALYPFRTYLLLKPNADPKKLEAKFPAFLKANMDFYADMVKAGNYMRMNLTPLAEIHLYSNRTDELGANGNAQYVKVFFIAAVFILLIACFNFMNLSTARAGKRALEVGIRKVLGSSRRSLIAQFLTESLMVTSAAIFVALILTWAALPWFNQISGKQLSLSIRTNVWILPVLTGFVLGIGFLSGVYPSLLLSGFKPINVLKNKLPMGMTGVRLRNGLVIFQFTISIFLMVCTLVVYNQLNYIRNKDLGFGRDQVLIIKNMNSLQGNDAIRLKQEVKRLGEVKDATLSSFLPVGARRWGNFVLANDKEIQTQFWPVDEDYLGTMGMSLVKGRNFSKQFSTDSNAVLINESAAKMLTYNDGDPINKLVQVGKDKYLHIIGIVRDFNFNSLRENVTPTMFVQICGWSQKLEGDGPDNLAIKTRSGNLDAVLASVEKYWKTFGMKHALEYSFMDDEFNEQYKGEQQMAKLFISFAILSIGIACLGLFGLSAYAAEQRIREIGIRKVLGAGVANIVALLSFDFLKLILVAIVLAMPIALVVMQNWLQHFAYRIDIKWLTFIFAGMAAIVVALITVSFQSLKAAIINPATTLRTD